ncbi:MAG TPA: thioredoxin family protein [Gemmatimonadales bacterium]|nr:thioredoxin family protein [Gemmatimonadales bacterium]
MIDFKELWAKGMTFAQFVAVADERYRGLWEGVYRIASVPEWARLPGTEERKLLVLAEDWCGDASNIVPAVAKWADANPGLSLRIIRRDEYPAVMDRYLTRGSRSIPIVIVLDRDFHEIGHWGPRPSELQAWVMANKDTVPNPERYKEVRRWYAQDRGASTLRELMIAMAIRQAA